MLHKGLLAYDPAAPIVLHQGGVFGLLLGHAGSILRRVRARGGRGWTIVGEAAGVGAGGAYRQTSPGKRSQSSTSGPASIAARRAR